MPTQAPWSAPTADAPSIASRLPESLRWIGGAALEGLKQVTGMGTGDPNSAMGVGAPLMAAESEGPLSRVAREASGSALDSLKGLYSRVSKTAMEQLPEWVHPAKALSLFKNNASKEELDYRGLTNLLNTAQGPAKMPKQAILDHLEQNPVPDVRVKTLGMPSQNLTEYANREPGSVVQYNRPDLNLPGGKNYTESLFKLPVNRSYDAEEAAILAKPLNERTHEDYANLARRQEEGTLAPPTPTYTHDHWPHESNVLAHTREDIRPDATGKPGKFLQEVQSDWHQQGKENGYQLRELPKEAKVLHGSDFAHDNSVYWVEHNSQQYPSKPTESEAREAALRMMNSQSGGLAPPDAPFKDTWPDLTLKKHVLDVAHDPNLEWLGFTKGETQARRANQLAEHVHSVFYDRNNNELIAYPKEGNVLSYDSVMPEDLPRYIGRELTDRMLASENRANTHMLTGLDLQMGGEGMKHFYDEKLPSRLGKILKPFGGQVEEGAVQTNIPKFTPGNVQDIGKAGEELPARHYTGQVRDPNQGHVASTWPPRPSALGVIPEVRGDMDNLVSLMQKGAKPNTVPAWLARFTPEMKAEILKKGLPLLSLMGLMQPAVSHDQQGVQ